MRQILILLAFLLMHGAIEAQELRINESVRFLALGDSYTIGQGVPETECWPNQLADSLEKRGFEFEELKIIARTGWRTDNLINALEIENPDSDYNLVSLLIGVNNQYQGINFEVYPDEFSELLDRAIVYCGGETSGVFVFSIPDYGYTPFGSSRKETISREIDRYNETNKRIAQKRGVTYIDITPISREAEEKPEYLASDNLHPSGIMYAHWVKEVINHINFNSQLEISLNMKVRGGTLYPNPATNRVSYISEKPVASITIYNLLGNHIVSQQIQDHHFDMDISGLIPGVYFFRIIMTDQSFVSGKLMVK